MFAGDRPFSEVQKTFNFSTRAVTPSGSVAASDGRIDTHAIDVNGDGIPNPPSGPRVLDPATARHCMDQGVLTGSQFGTTQERAIDGGNASLKAETARVATAGVVFEPPPVKGLAFKTDLFASYELKSKAGTTRPSVGVNNVLDRQPPVIYTGPAANAANSDPGTYDYMGRFLYARLAQIF